MEKRSWDKKRRPHLSKACLKISQPNSLSCIPHIIKTVSKFKKTKLLLVKNAHHFLWLIFRDHYNQEFVKALWRELYQAILP